MLLKKKRGLGQHSQHIVLMDAGAGCPIGAKYLIHFIYATYKTQLIKVGQEDVPYQ
jgi:hypothetical protein